MCLLCLYLLTLPLLHTRVNSWVVLIFHNSTVFVAHIVALVMGRFHLVPVSCLSGVILATVVNPGVLLAVRVPFLPPSVTVEEIPMYTNLRVHTCAQTLL